MIFKEIDWFKADIFSLGLVMIQACILFDSQEIKIFRVIESLYEQRKNEVFETIETRYGGLLADILKGMTNLQSSQRYSL